MNNLNSETKKAWEMHVKATYGRNTDPSDKNLTVEKRIFEAEHKALLMMVKLKIMDLKLQEKNFEIKRLTKLSRRKNPRS
jgi:hypothetical protein